MKKTIWITRRLSNEERQFCDSLGLNCEEVPAIEVKLNPIDEKDVPHSAAWAFTSQHAVAWIGKVIEAGLMKPEWLPDQWFAIGQKTAQAIREIKFEPILPDKAYGSNLAVLLDTYKVRSVVHFTGNLARPELAQLCLMFGINYHPFEVYKTEVLEPNDFPKSEPDGILFLSPSAVEGFTSSEKASKRLANTKLFAIGKTTQDALAKQGFQSTIPPQANFKELVQFASKNL